MMKLSLASLFVYLVILLILQSITFLLEKYTAKSRCKSINLHLPNCLDNRPMPFCLPALLLGFSCNIYYGILAQCFLLLADILLLKTAMCINIPVRIPINRNKISEISKAPNHIKILKQFNANSYQTTI